MCSTSNAGLVRSLGAAHVIDYTTGDFARDRARHDVILETWATSGCAGCAGR